MTTSRTNERSPLANLFLGYGFDAMTSDHAEHAGSSVTDVLTQALARYTRSTNSNNRAGKRGRNPKVGWDIICGMDPVDTLMLPIIMARLGHQWPAADYDKLIEKHALEVGDATLKGVTINTKLKSLRECQRADIRIRLEQAQAELPLDQAGLTRALQELIARAALHLI